MNQSNIYSRDDLERRLSELVETKYKKVYTMALCYIIGDVAPMDYVCPYCGKTTTQTSYIVWAIEEIRKIVRQMSFHGYDAIIDEREFCIHCGENAKEYLEVDLDGMHVSELVDTIKEHESTRPEVVFQIRFDEESNYHIARSTIISEYQNVLDFLKGKDSFLDDKGRHKGGRDITIVLRKMLGIS